MRVAGFWVRKITTRVQARAGTNPRGVAWNGARTNMLQLRACTVQAEAHKCAYARILANHLTHMPHGMNSHGNTA